jgi:Zn-dependent metalloprotease
MSVHESCCMFVPPYVLETLARNGRENALQTLQQTKLSLAKRSSKVIPMEVLSQIAPPGQGPRKVYDCGHKWEQRINLVRDEGAPTSADEAINKAYDFSGKVRDYWDKALNRNSIDNAGMDIIINVHFGVGYDNAFWDGDDVTLGDGDGIIFVNFAKSLDVVAHELAHGVTQYTANFDYYGQPGALHEHFSDVFGSVVKQFAYGQTAQNADWLIGNEIMGPELYGESLRSMKAPGTAYDNPLIGKDPQPDHMKDYYTGLDDNQGVHYNSGIPNKAFYLVAMEIGTDKAALIWYHALQRLWSSAVFNDAVKMIVDSARILVKDGQVPVNSAQIIRAAFKAVGLPS